MNSILKVCASVAFAVWGGAAHAISVGVFAPDNTASVISFLNSSGAFTSVTELSSDAPSLAEMNNYDVLFTWSNFTYPSPAATGDALKSYVDGGGGVLVSTYATSETWSLQGGITEDGYLPLEVTQQGYTPSFPLTSPVPSDGVFDGVNIANIIGSPNNNHADAALDVGATLLLQDAGGANIMARNADGNVYALALWPNVMNTNADYQKLVVNTLVDLASDDSMAVPLPATLPLLVVAFGGLTVLRRRQKKVS